MKTILFVMTLFLFACNTNTRNEGKVESSESLTKEKSTDSISITPDKPGEIYSAVMFDKIHSSEAEDTLIIRTKKGEFIITPYGRFKNINGDTVQLKTELIVENAYLYLDNKFLYIFFTDTDHDGATSWVQKINKENLKTIYTTEIPGFNLGQPIIRGNKAYVTAIGLIGKLNLDTGKYDWIREDLYDRGKASFNSFDTVLLSNNQTEFLSKHYLRNQIDKVIVDNTTGKIIKIVK